MINGVHETKAEYQARINRLKDERAEANLAYSQAREGSIERLNALRQLIHALEAEYTARTTGWQEEDWAEEWRWEEQEQDSRHQYWINRLLQQLSERRIEEAQLSRVLEAQGQMVPFWHGELK